VRGAAIVDRVDRDAEPVTGAIAIAPVHEPGHPAGARRMVHASPDIEVLVIVEHADLGRRGCGLAVVRRFLGEVTRRRGIAPVGFVEPAIDLDRSGQPMRLERSDRTSGRTSGRTYRRRG
jgi:hypothetical protein